MKKMMMMNEMWNDNEWIMKKMMNENEWEW